MNSLETYWRLAISGGGGIVGSLIRGLLSAVTLPYQCIAFCLDKAYTWGLIKTKRPPKTCIISVGNLVIGGTGKTPFVLMLVESLNSNAKLAVLSRGYRSQAEKARTPQLFIPGQTRPPPSVCGDEPYLLMNRLSSNASILFVVGRHRRHAADLAAKADAEVLLLDDGFQHRRLARDLDIVLIDAHAPFGNGYLFPRGVLRESPKALSRAHLLVINHAKDSAHFDRISQQLKRYSTAPIIGTTVQVGEMQALDGTHLPPLKGVKVGLFCGIANPQHFRETARQIGVEPVAECFSSDHQLPKPEVLTTFAKNCRQLGASWLLCTEKDSVKLTSVQLALPIAFIPIDLKVTENKPAWTAFLAAITTNARA